MCVCACDCACLHVHANLNEFILDDLCSLQLCLNDLDELVCPVFCLNVAETSFLNELQDRRGKVQWEQQQQLTDIINTLAPHSAHSHTICAFELSVQ